MHSVVRSLFLSLLLLAVAVIDTGGYARNPGGGVPQPAGQVINIDPNDDSCTPVAAGVGNCARACEINPLGCAKDLLKHVESTGFIKRRQLYPLSIEQKPNIQTPMHGLFVPAWNNPQLNEAINRAIRNPLAPIRMPNWSISEKLNNSPGTPSKPGPHQPELGHRHVQDTGLLSGQRPGISDRRGAPIMQGRRVVLVFISGQLFGLRL